MPIYMDFDNLVPNFKKLMTAFASQQPYNEVYPIFKNWARRDVSRELQKNLSGKELGRRTGTLARRSRIFIDNRIKRDKILNIGVGVNKELPYSHIHDNPEGHKKGFTVIRKKRAKALTVPVKASDGKYYALTPAGVKIKEPAEWFKQKNVFSAKGYIWLDRKNKIVPLFKYMDSVKIPNRPWATNALINAIPKFEVQFSTQGFKRLGDYTMSILGGSIK